MTSIGRHGGAIVRVSGGQVGRLPEAFYVIRKCVGGDDAGVAGESEFSNNHFWMRVGGKFIACYNSLVKTSSESDNFCIREDPLGTPADCDDVLLRFFTDPFDGSVLHCMWEQTGDGSYVVSDGSLNLFPDFGEGQVYGYGQKITVDVTGDFNVELDYGSFTTSDGDLWVTCAAGNYNISYHNYGSNPNTGRIEDHTGSYTNVGKQVTGSLRARRVSGTIYLDYKFGGGWTNFSSFSDSGTLGSMGVSTITVYESVEPTVSINDWRVNP